MKGSGLSLERFVKGKAHKTKTEAKGKKKVIIHKALRKREYEKIKKNEGKKQPQNGAVQNEHDDNKPTSFYDRFFNDLQKEENDSGSNKKSNGHMNVRPDPLYKAKKKAEIAKQEKHRAREEKQKKYEQMEKKIVDRKKRHVKLSVRTATGQPVVRNHIKDMLAKLQAEKR